MARNKFFAKLSTMDGAVKGDYNPLEHCLRTPSPSINWVFGNIGGGLPFGYSTLMYGPPKHGKSVVVNLMAGQLHKDDPEAGALVLNTELRGEIQSSPLQHAMWGIDTDRYQAFDRNTPDGVFDFITNEIDSMCQDGLKLRMLVIDSLSGIQGRRAQDQDTIMTQQRGDLALTIQEGIKRILPIIRKHRIALVMTDHIRAEQDTAQQMRGKTVRVASSFATKHTAEYFLWVEKNQSKDGRSTLAGEAFEDADTKDFMDKAERTGHKIRVRMDESSLGVAGRTGEFTLDYDRGIINTYEEVFTLGKNLGVITKPGGSYFQYGEQKWNGLKSCLTAIRDDKELYAKILAEIEAKA